MVDAAIVTVTPFTAIFIAVFILGIYLCKKFDVSFKRTFPRKNLGKGVSRLNSKQKRSLR